MSEFAARRNQDPSKESLNKNVEALMAAASRRQPDNPRHLGPDGQKSATLYLGTEALAEKQLPGNRKEVLHDLVIMGDTVLGLSRVYDFNRATPKVEQVRVSILPLGSNSEKTSSTTIIVQDLDSLSKPNEQGVIQSFRTFAVGRENLAQVMGAADDSVSRGQHLELTIGQDASVALLDGTRDRSSTNGTEVIGFNDAFDATMAAPLAGVAQELAAKPYLWDEQHAGQTVVNPYE